MGMGGVDANTLGLRDSHSAAGGGPGQHHAEEGGSVHGVPRRHRTAEPEHIQWGRRAGRRMLWGVCRRRLGNHPALDFQAPDHKCMKLWCSDAFLELAPPPANPFMCPPILVATTWKSQITTPWIDANPPQRWSSFGGLHRFTYAMPSSPCISNLCLVCT